MRLPQALGSLLQAPGFLDYGLLGKQRRKDGPASFAVPALPICHKQQWKGDLMASARGTEALTKLRRSYQEQLRSQNVQSAWKVAKS